MRNDGRYTSASERPDYPLKLSQKVRQRKKIGLMSRAAINQEVADIWAVMLN